LAENDFYIGVQFKQCDEEYTGQNVGTTDHYLEVTRGSDPNYTLSNGLLTNATPNFPLEDGTYSAHVTRTSADLWTLRFDHAGLNTTTVLETIQFDSVGDKKIHFVVGDRSNVESTFNVAITATDGVYNSTPKQYDLQQIHNELKINGLVSVSDNAVCIKPKTVASAITAKSINRSNFCHRRDYSRLDSTSNPAYVRRVGLYHRRPCKRDGSQSNACKFQQRGISKGIKQQVLYCPE
jgi:hypothetical protein